MADEALLDDRRQAVLEAAARYARETLENDASGHDWWHIYRVDRLAETIANAEGADVFVCRLAALLHDIADEKLCGDEAEGLRAVRRWLDAHRVDAASADHVIGIISSMSFKGGGRPPMRTLEGRVVQDADRLDAIGAVGIARVFAYTGAKGRPIHVPGIEARERMTKDEYRSTGGTAINHFYEKLLKLKDLMNTDYAKRLAEGRHRQLEQYLACFYEEWEGIR
ncbi:HD domain-containing protein [Paenibacillus hamazuiensis]|uniref:HD domain-containing protein n=1 Tax=Paenibacillus hamazuiensis TaxID=2936508 RepID=UPI00200D67F9|nr:HD domain-containing protein [Paenibacillus hamazuiensis]